MAGAGGGPPRRSHTKSRKGCETCKRRHIRCDENFPQCRNCTKHNVQCPYRDMSVSEARPTSPDRADLLWTPEIKAAVGTWLSSGQFPFPGLGVAPTPKPQAYTAEELRLIYHVAAISWELNSQDCGGFTVWTKQIALLISIGASHPYVMSALLAFSATHLAWLTDCPLTSNMAYKYRGIALKGLHEAIGSFSKRNSDAVLAASLLLSWQTNEWRGWTQLMHGTSSIIDAMNPWSHESRFGDFIAEQGTFATTPPSPQPGAAYIDQGCGVLVEFYAHLRRVESYVRAQRGNMQPISQLMTFIGSAQAVSSQLTASQRFELLEPLRAWLFWLPVTLLQRTESSSASLITLAYYYAAALVIEPLFPEVGVAYFCSLSLLPIEQIARRLLSNSSVSTLEGSMIELLAYPVDMVSRFRARMGWVQPHPAVSLPAPHDMAGRRSLTPDVPTINAAITLYDEPSFAYSDEQLLSRPESQISLSPLIMDMFPGQYLSLPSPSIAEAFSSNSPGSSNFGEESIILGEHREDFALYEGPCGQEVKFGSLNPAIWA